ncbi:MAG: transposase [Actinomycetota bacterium]
MLPSDFPCWKTVYYYFLCLANRWHLGALLGQNLGGWGRSGAKLYAICD